MKKTIIFILVFILLGIISYAQNDTLYIMKNGVISAKYNVNNQIDSVIFYDPFPTRGVFTDSRDGNSYNWVKIGTQIWMAENLKYLPSVVGPDAASTSVPYYYVIDYYGTDVTAAKATSQYNTYGVLYNWPAAMAGSPSSTANPSGVQGICPSGWHLPSVSEWYQLINLLGGSSQAGGKLKEEGTTHWLSPNVGATNETGFTALPGGVKYSNYFVNYYDVAWWWSSQINSPGWGTYIYTLNNPNYIRPEYNLISVAVNVRCVKN